MDYDKLIRDKIPSIIKKDGRTPKIHTAKRGEYRIKLNQKLLEEVREFGKSGEIYELADILEVVYALAEAEHVTAARLEALRKKRAAERGAFKKRIILDKVL
jgi:predicted house-cleaning noncanonical NTP pyrophosphatase (MazG superfamily)